MNKIDSIIFIIIIVVLPLDAFCDVIPNQHKSYTCAIAGSLLLPVVGHGYVGGDNYRRGLYYTGGEALNLFLGTICSIEDKNQGMEYFYWVGAIHIASMLDAIISVYNINNRKHDKSYIIASAGSAVFPNIGHGYLKNKNNLMRGWVYSFFETVSFLSDNEELVMGIRLLSTADAAFSTYQVNKINKTEIIFRPGVKSGYLLLLKTF